MKRKIGSTLVLLGLIMMLGAAALLFYNHREAEQAGNVAQDKLSQLVLQIEQKQQMQIQKPPDPPSQVSDETEETFSNITDETEVVLPGTPMELIPSEALEMEEVVIDGDSYIGYLSIPSLELDLPVMSNWSNSKLQISPCRYTGNLLTEDLVIMAHNYARHFGEISDLSAGDLVYFTDVNGETTQFEVIAREVLPPDAIEDMTAGEFDLTLFTCTYGGGSRVTVRCDMKPD